MHVAVENERPPISSDLNERSSWALGALDGAMAMVVAVIDVVMQEQLHRWKKARAPSTGAACRFIFGCRTEILRAADAHGTAQENDGYLMFATLQQAGHRITR